LSAPQILLWQVGAVCWPSAYHINGIPGLLSGSILFTMTGGTCCQIIPTA
jgi:hypothetical protein